MENKERQSVDEIINFGASPERFFPIVNKFDRIWRHYDNKSFCEVYQMVMENKNNLPDIEFTQWMEEYINKNNIK